MINKRKILFVINDLNFGGAQQSLINLLKNIDYDYYEVDIQLMEKGGELENDIPHEINILETPKNYKYFDTSFKNVVKDNFFNLNWKIILNRIFYKITFNSKNTLARNEQIRWVFLKKIIAKNSKKYDVSIGYLEKTPHYYVLDKTIASKKIVWIHTDYNNLEINKAFEKKYFDKVNDIVAVSDSVLDSLVNIFPNCIQKITVMNSIFSSEEIKCLSQEEIEEDIKNDCAIVSVGRLVKEKAFDRAIETAIILKNRNVKFVWYIIGEGDVREDLEKLILKNKLEEQVLLLGYKKNPYPYISSSKIYVQTSIFEGFALTIQEAKVLRKPVVCTNFKAASGHIIDRKNGFIVNPIPEEIADVIENLLNNNVLREEIISNIELIETNEKIIVQKFNKLVSE